MTTGFIGVEIEDILRGDYVDYRGSVTAASTANFTIGTTDFTVTAVDGVTLAAGERFLLKDQTTASENGIYVAIAGAGASVRAEDLITGDAANVNHFWVKEGTANAGTAWVCTSAAGSDVVDTDNLTFVQYDVAGTLSIDRGGTGTTTLSPGNRIVQTNAGATALETTTTPVIVDILDTNLLELLRFTATGAAVNEFTITNAATGTAPSITTSGDDANIDFDLETKGTGVFNFRALDGATSAEIRLEDNTGGEYAGIISPATITTSYTLTLPGDTGTVGQVLTTDGASPVATLSWTTVGTANRHFQILNKRETARSVVYQTVGYFPWDDSDVGAFTTATVTFWCDASGDRDLDIEVFNRTTTTSLGTLNVPTLTAAGIQTFTFTVPVADAQLEVRIKKDANGGDSPDIFGLYITLT